MSEAKQSAVERGQAVYSPLVLSIYDVFVLGLSNRFLWRCPTRELLALYDRSIGARHLDIGVGTGYFLDRAAWPVRKPDITLVDLNRNSLAAATRRIARHEPTPVIANALKPLPFAASTEPFQSVALCYLLHCLPGTMAEKSVVFDHVIPVMGPGSRIFGATIVQGSAPRSRPAQKLMDIYNAKGIFSNRSDTIEELETALQNCFANVRVSLRGAVALFEAEHP